MTDYIDKLEACKFWMACWIEISDRARQQMEVYERTGFLLSSLTPERLEPFNVWYNRTTPEQREEAKRIDPYSTKDIQSKLKTTITWSRLH